MKHLLVLAVGLLVAGSLFAEPIALLEANSTSFALRYIDSTNPAVTLRFVPITGLQPGEILSGIDYRPSDGYLYGIGALGGSTARLYRINTVTGFATQIGAPFTLDAANVIGMDFFPSNIFGQDRLRVISNAGTHLRIDADTGAIAGTDTPPHYAPGDPNAGAGNPPWGLGYTSGIEISPALYGLTYGLNSMILVAVGGASGEMVTVGSTGITNFSSESVGLDITRGGTAYALMNDPVRLYTIDLTTGASTLLGNLPATTFGSYRDLAEATPGGRDAFVLLAAPALSARMLLVLAMILGAAGVYVMKR